MSLSVQLCNNESPVEKIGKSFTSGSTYSCVLKENTSVLKPILKIRTTDNIYSFNYMYISAFSRYYFIDDIISINNDIWEVHGHVDVLETYKNDILEQRAVIARQQNKYNLYLNDPDFRTYNNDTIQTKLFSIPNSGGFSKTLSYVLAVNGS